MSTKPLTVVTAYKLSSEELGLIMDKIGLKKSQSFVPVNVVDQSILGGVIIKFEGFYLDFSLKNKLKEIVDSLN
jgi:F0F1-type ATP synthase delta subunit